MKWPQPLPRNPEKGNIRESGNPSNSWRKRPRNFHGGSTTGPVHPIMFVTLVLLLSPSWAPSVSSGSRPQTPRSLAAGWTRSHGLRLLGQQAPEAFREEP